MTNFVPFLEWPSNGVPLSFPCTGLLAQEAEIRISMTWLLNWSTTVGWATPFFSCHHFIWYSPVTADWGVAPEPDQATFAWPIFPTSEENIHLLWVFQHSHHPAPGPHFLFNFTGLNEDILHALLLRDNFITSHVMPHFTFLSDWFVNFWTPDYGWCCCSCIQSHQSGRYIVWWGSAVSSLVFH